MDDAATFFGNVFGGDRFRDFVRLYSFPKNITRKTEPDLDWRSCFDEGDDIDGVGGHDRGGKD
jgi:hypothetical protein